MFGGILYGHIRQRVAKYRGSLRQSRLYIYLSKVLTERFSIQNKIQTKKDIRLYILTLVLVDINFTFSAKVWIQFFKSFDCDRFS